MTALPLPVVSLLLFTPLCIAFGQILFKTSSASFEKSGEPFHMIVLHPLFILAVAIYGFATLLWVYVLKTVPLTYAYSFMALSFVFVPVLAFFILNETFTVRYFIGAATIMLGLAIIQN